jgi:hypothetical protein
MRTLVVVSQFIALAGCASQEPVITAATAPTLVAGESTTLTPQSKIVCHKEAQLGTVVMRTVCETEQSAADRIALQERLRNMARPSSNPHPGQ